MKCEKENHVGYHIHHLTHDIVKILNKKFEKYGITYSQFNIIRILWEKEGQTQKEILENLSIKPSSLSGILDLLEKKELVKRIIDEKDARINRIYITEKGKNIKQLSIEIFNETDKILTQGFSDEEKSLLLLWLKRIKKNIE